MERPSKSDHLDCEFDEQPTEAGFYPGCVSWEAHEGGFPAGLYWNGSAWDREDGPPVYYLPDRFDNKEAAEARARELDLGW